MPAKDEGVKYACNQCDHQFTQQGSLSKHIQSVHEGVKYACNQCDHHYTQKGNLTRHIQSVHHIIIHIKLHNREIWQNISKLKMMNNIFPHLSYLWQGKAMYSWRGGWFWSVSMLDSVHEDYQLWLENSSNPFGVQTRVTTTPEHLSLG